MVYAFFTRKMSVNQLNSGGVCRCHASINLFWHRKKCNCFVHYKTVPTLLQARHQDLAAEGDKNQMEGTKAIRGATLLKYCIGWMEQPGGQMWNRGTQISNGGFWHHFPPLATTLPFCKDRRWCPDEAPMFCSPI